MQKGYLSVFFYRHVHPHVVHWVAGVDVQHVVVRALSALEDFLVGEVKGHSVMRRQLQGNSESICFSESDQAASSIMSFDK